MTDFLDCGDVAETMSAAQKSFFSCCFEKADRRSTAAQLLAHEYFDSRNNDDTYCERDRKMSPEITNFLRKGLVEHSSIDTALTTDDVDDAALTILKIRAKHALSLSAKSSTILSKQVS